MIRHCFLLILLWVISGASFAQDLPRSTPGAQGVALDGLIDFIRTADSNVNSMHSFMLLRHGHVVCEAWWSPEAADKPHVLWSLSKSFTSTAVGLAIEEGKLSLDAEVTKFFPEECPSNPSDYLKAMRVRDLLTMATGHQDEVSLKNESDWIKAFLNHPVPHKPGTHFRYNTPATFMQSAIVQKVIGEKVVDYLQPRLFEPLGIKKPKWDENPQGISIGGYGLYLTTEDIAKFGQLYLQNGSWNGRQLLPKKWVELATSKQVSNGNNPNSDWEQGYGFQFWRCRHDAYRGDGKDGQFCVVLPQYDAVIVMTANSANMQAQLAVVWDKLLASFEDSVVKDDARKLDELKELISNLKAKR